MMLTSLMKYKINKASSWKKKGISFSRPRILRTKITKKKDGKSMKKKTFKQR